MYNYLGIQLIGTLAMGTQTITMENENEITYRR